MDSSPYSLPSSSSSLPAPLTRSRTLFFLSVRSSFSHPGSGSSRNPYSQRTSYSRDDLDGDDDAVGGSYDNAERVGLMANSSSSSGGRDNEKGKGQMAAGGTGDETRIDMEPRLPPRWVDVSDSVNAILTQVTAMIAKLDKLHAKHVLPGFKDRTAEEREIESLTTAITREFRQAQAKIKTIRVESQPPTQAELVSATNVQRGLASKVQDLSGTFRRKQRVYMQKLQGHAIKNADVLISSGAGFNANSSGSSGREEGLLEMEEDLQASQSQLQQSTTLSTSLDSTIRQRDQELSSIARSITELATLFQDLGDMVVEQGTLLDSVEYNLEVVGREMEGAVEELRVATTYQKSTGRRKCIFLLFLMCIGLVIVIIYKPRSHPATSASSPPILVSSASSSEPTATPRHL